MNKLILMSLILTLAAVPSWADKKLTVKQLGDLLTDLQKQSKTDAEVADELKQVELTEQLDRATMNSMAGAVPGQLSTEQIYVLEAKSAMLPPPAADVSTNPAPDSAAQNAILAKALNYADKSLKALPSLTASKTTLRFQDNLQAIGNSSGMSGSAKDLSVSGGTGALNMFVRYINSTTSHVTFQAGSEAASNEKDKTPWGQNGMLALEDPGPSVTSILDEAQASGHITFSRWQTLLGRNTAVFAYTIDKKKSRYNVRICCFPEVSQAGMVQFSSASTGSMNGGSGGGAKGNFQTNTQWDHYKSTLPYHGELFIDPDTGTILRLTTMVEFKKSDYIHQLDQRIDFAPMQVGSQTLVLPARSIIQNEAVPQGDSGVGGNTTRHTYLISEFKNYTAK